MATNSFHLALLLLFYFNGDCHGLRFEKNRYEDLLVTISPDIPKENAQAVIDGIESWITEGSSTLNVSTFGWASVNTVRILLPSSWTNINNTVSVDGMVYEDGDVRVGPTGGVHGDSPFTSQTGGCGEPGQFIQVSKDFVTGLDNMEGIYGPLGHVFVHEFAKYRYGIFEEHGYPGDEKYPMFYHKTVFDINGEVNRLEPNLCINKDISYTMQDFTTQGDCRNDPMTGLPDSNCVLKVTAGNGLQSSIMSLPYIDTNHFFCDDSEEYYHNAQSPNKHNALCNGRSTFSVVKQHADFQGFDEGHSQSNVMPNFILLRPEVTSTFVMVLDKSNSMNKEKRFERLKAATDRFLTYDIDNDVPVGAVAFCLDMQEVFKIQPVNNANRKELINKIMALDTCLYTCLGDALLEGLEKLKGYGLQKGGVIVFITDGQYACQQNPNTISNVIQKVVDQEVRVIAIAFGPKADPAIATLAERTNGAAYFIPDNTGPEDINNAFQASLSFQSSKPSDKIDVIVIKETFKNAQNISFSTVIDKSLGNDVKLQIDFSGNSGSSITVNNETHEFVDNEGVFAMNYNQYDKEELTIDVQSSSKIEFTSVSITSKAANGTMPIMASCSTNFGATKADLSSPDARIIVTSQVQQGGNPVIGAKVMGILERGNQQPVEFELFDNGNDPDTIANDGIYARFLTDFEHVDDETRYNIKCRVEAVDGTSVNEGSSSSLKSLPINPSLSQPICCGSSSLRPDSVLTPTGGFQRSQAGGMLTILKASKIDYPPGKITNLKVRQLSDYSSFNISFTSPGAVLDSGIVDDLRIFFSNNLTAINLVGDYLQLEEIDEDDVIDGSLEPKKAGEAMAITVGLNRFKKDSLFYFKAVSTFNNVSAESNVANAFFATEVNGAPSLLALNLFLVLFACLFSLSFMS